jgi:hypothetical protein
LQAELERAHLHMQKFGAIQQEVHNLQDIIDENQTKSRASLNEQQLTALEDSNLKL